MTVEELIEELKKYDKNMVLVRPIDNCDEPVCCIDSVEIYNDGTQNPVVLIW